jgi:hypothetical protein
MRQKGMGRFILITGILSYGLPMFAIMTFYVNRRPDQPLTALHIVIPVVVWTLGGAAFGFIMWKLNEGRYQRFLAKKKSGEA